MNNDNVKAWRNARAMTQSQASETLGLSLRQYQRIEAGISKVSGPIERLILNR